jgi:hypothetical protein
MASACADATTTGVRGPNIPQGGPTAAQAATVSSSQSGTGTGTAKAGGATAQPTESAPSTDKVRPAKDFSGIDRYREPSHPRR